MSARVARTRQAKDEKEEQAEASVEEALVSALQDPEEEEGATLRAHSGATDAVC